MFFPGAAVYMEKIAAGADAVDAIDITATPTENVNAVAKAKGVTPTDLRVVVLERERHEQLIGELRQAGARVNLIRDGDVAPAIAAARPGTGVDLLYGIGGTPEGVISAAALKCLGGGIQGRLWPRDDEERRALIAAGLDLDRVLTTDDLVAGDDVFVAATGVTTGALLRGVRYVRDGAITDSIVMRSRSGTVRRIEARHDLEQAHALHREGVHMSNPIGIDDLGYDQQLYILAFDHRGSFEKMVGGGQEKIAGAKQLIWEGFQRAVDGRRAQGRGRRPRRRPVRRRRRPRGEGGRLHARDAGREVGPERVRLRVRRAFGDKIEEFDPDFSKVLVRYNPEGDAS